MKFLVSIILCTYNRSQHLKNTLDSIIVQEKDDGFDFEIIVVDNNSKDDTRAIVESYMPRFIGNLKYCLEVKQGKSYALNRGVQEARGDIVAFTDDDVLVDSHWLYHLIECFEKYGCDGVGGRVLPVFPQGAPRWIKDNPHKAAGAVVIYDHGEQTKKHENSMELFIGANYAFRQGAFTQCGTFRTDLKFGGIAVGEDREFIRRLIKAGKVLYYCGQALVWHPVNLNRLGFKHMVRWHMALGRSVARVESEKQNKKISYYWGIPEYLFRRVTTDFLFLVLNFFNWLMFWRYFRSFFYSLGMMSEYWTISKKKTRGSQDG